jgi:hypothetical protein
VLFAANIKYIRNITIVIENHESKIPFGRLRHRWENIKTDPKAINCEGCEDFSGSGFF